MHHRTLFALALFGLAAAASTAQVTILPQGYVARSVSADGQTVVGFHPGGVFRWTPSGGVQNIPGMPGGLPEVSDDGQTIVSFSGENVYRWTQPSGAVLIGQGINPVVSGDGSVVAYVHQSQIYRWTNAGATLVPTSSGGAMTLTGISGDGSTIVGGEAVPGSFGPFRWTQATGGSMLGHLPNSGLDAHATAVSHDGSVVYGVAASPIGYDTFRWTQAGGMQALGVSSTGSSLFSFPFPQDATNDGSILVGATFTHAFFWRMGYGPALLEDVVENEFGMSFGDMFPRVAWGISADGTTVVGSGSLSTGNGGWIVHLPHPIPAPGASLLLLAPVGLMMRRRRTA